MLKKLGIIVGALMVCSSVMFAGIFDFLKPYNYITASQTAKLIKENPQSIVIVDIQKQPAFAKEHLKGAVSTYAYPVKKQPELDRLEKLIPTFKANQKIIVICPRGAGGAERTTDFYIKKGVNTEQLFILKNGQDGWPRDEINDVLEKS